MRNLIRHFIASILTIGFWLSAVSAQEVGGFTADYFGEVRDAYPTIFVAKVADSATINNERGEWCFYKYTFQVVEPVRGHLDKQLLTVFSDVGLATGSEYLVYFSEPDAKRYRYSFEPERYSACKRLLASYFLISKEIHPLQHHWNGNRDVREVEFSTSLQNYPLVEMRDEVHHMVSLEYVRGQLNK